MFLRKGVLPTYVACSPTNLDSLENDQTVPLVPKKQHKEPSFKNCRRGDSPSSLRKGKAGSRR